MRILIDECLDWRLCRTLPGHDCSSVQKMGWSGLTNGALREKAAQEFDVFLTGDRNLTFQQTLSRFDLAVVILHAESIQFASHGYSNAKGSLRASYASARSGRRRFWLRGCRAQLISHPEIRASRGLLPGRRLGGAIQRQPLKIDHFQLVGIVVGHEQRLAVRRVPELARERAGGHASQNRCLTCADVCRINHGQCLPRSSVAGKAV